MPETKEFTNSIGIAQTNRLFISIKQIGQCDGNGRAVMADGYNGKMIAEPDKPIQSLIGGVVMQMLNFARWSSLEAQEQDISVLRRFVEHLEASAAEKRKRLAK